MKRFFLFNIIFFITINCFGSWNVIFFDSTNTSTKIQLTNDRYILEYFTTKDISLKEALENFHTYLSNIIASSGVYYGQTEQIGLAKAIKYSLIIEGQRYLAITSIYSPHPEVVTSYTLMSKIPNNVTEISEPILNALTRAYIELRNIPTDQIQIKLKNDSIKRRN